MKRALLLIMLLLLASAAYADTFNIEIDLPDSYRDVEAGKELWFTSKLVNLANEKRIDVTLKYDIIDATEQSLASKSETVAIETQASFVGTIKVPKRLPEGPYQLKVSVAPVASSFKPSHAETTFHIVKNARQKKIDMTMYYIAGGMVLLVIILFLVIRLRPVFKKMGLKAKVWFMVRKKHLNRK